MININELSWSDLQRVRKQRQPAPHPVKDVYKYVDQDKIFDSYVSWASPRKSVVGFLSTGNEHASLVKAVVGTYFDVRSERAMVRAAIEQAKGLALPKSHSLIIEVIPAIPVSSSAQDDNSHSSVRPRFPSDKLATLLRNAVNARSRSYSKIAVAVEGSLNKEGELTLYEANSLIAGAIKQALSTLASVAKLLPEKAIKLNEGRAPTQVFEDLLKQYLPPISSDSFCSIGNSLIVELSEEARTYDFVVDSGKVVFDGKNLILEFRKVDRPGLLGARQEEFLAATPL